MARKSSRSLRKTGQHALGDKVAVEAWKYMLTRRCTGVRPGHEWQQDQRKQKAFAGHPYQKIHGPSP
jgi:hypothetical protein